MGVAMEKQLNELTIEITQRCPNRCLFCSSVASMEAKHQLSMEVIERLCVEAKDLGLECVSLSGGEPLLHPDIASICEPIHSLGLGIRLYTTGIALDKAGGALLPCIDWTWLSARGTRLIFNVQSSDEKVHDSLAGRKGAHRQTMAALKAARSQGYTTEIHMVPNRLNLDSLKQSVIDFSKLGVDQISFLRLVPQGYAREHSKALLLEKNETKRQKSILHELSTMDLGPTGLRFGIPFSTILETYKKCTAGEKKLIIRYDGKVLPCEAFKDERLTTYILGNVYEHTLSILLKTGKSCSVLSLLKENTSFNEACPAQTLF